MISNNCSRRLKRLLLFLLQLLLIMAQVPVAADLAEDRVDHARLLLMATEGNWEDAIDFWTDDIVYQDPAFTVEGKDVMRSFMVGLFDFMEDYYLEIYDDVYDDSSGVYMAYWVFSGKVKPYGDIFGFLFNIPFASPAAFEAPGLSVLKFRESESQVYFHKDLFTEGDIWVNVPLWGRHVRQWRASYKCRVGGPL